MNDLKEATCSTQSRQCRSLFFFVVPSSLSTAEKILAEDVAIGACTGVECHKFLSV